MDIVSNPVEPIKKYFLETQGWSEDDFNSVLKSGLIKFAINPNESINQSLTNIIRAKRNIEILREFFIENERWSEKSFNEAMSNNLLALDVPSADCVKISIKRMELFYGVN